MKVLLYTKGDCRRSAAAKLFFFDLCAHLVNHGYDVELNEFNETEYDIVIVHWLDDKAINRILQHSPNARIGILNPSPLGLKRRLGIAKHFLENVDFFIVGSLIWRDVLLKYGKRVYVLRDYEVLDGRSPKAHYKKSPTIIGYHGNHLHFKDEFFPNGANALRKLAKEHDILLLVFTRNALNQPGIKGVKIEYQEYSEAKRDEILSLFDIGICPGLASCEELSDPLKYIRNPNRIISLLSYGIPSVAAPIPQSLQDLEAQQYVLYAVSEQAWYEELKRLIVSPSLRNKIGTKGFQLVKDKFSEKSAVSNFSSMIETELGHLPTEKKGFPKNFRLAKLILNRTNSLLVKIFGSV